MEIWMALGDIPKMQIEKNKLNFERGQNLVGQNIQSDKSDQIFEK